jgi:hypothetical protein
MKPRLRWRLLPDGYWGVWLVLQATESWHRIPNFKGLPNRYIADVVTMNIYGEAWGEGEGEYVS